MATQNLMIELNERSQEDLNWLCQAEELNKTTEINRAIQVYRMILEEQMKGGTVTVSGKALLFT